MLYSLRDLIKELNIPLSCEQRFKKVLFDYFHFIPSHRLQNGKISLSREEIEWVSKTICDVDRLKYFSKQLYIRNSIEKYGVESPNQFYDKRIKCSNTIKNSEIGNNRQKYFETCENKYGVRSVNSLPDKINKAKKTCQQRYGGNSSACAGSEIRKIQTEHSLQTKLKKYGTITLNHKYFYKDLYFHSKLEFFFYIYHTEVLHEQVKRGPHFEYIYKGKKHIYECDFQIDDKLYEIKGPHLLSVDKDGLVFPYIKQKKVDIKYTQGLYDEKYACMKRNDVIILTDNDLTKEIEYGESRFNDLLSRNELRKK